MKKMFLLAALLFGACQLQAQNPTDFDIDTTMLPGKKMIVTVTLNQPEFIGTSFVHAWPISYWCMGQASPEMFLGAFMPNPFDTIPNVGISRTDTIDFSLYDANCSNPNFFAFKYVVIGLPQGDTAGAFADIFWIEKILEIQVNPTLGVDNYLSGDAIKIYPNPATDRISILGIQAGANICIMDLSGKVVVQQQLQNDNAIIDVSGFAPGIYMMTVSLGDQRVSKKILVQH